MPIVCIILSVVLVAVSLRLIFLKHDLRNISRDLFEITCADTNAKLTTESFDTDIADIAVKINAVLENSRRVIIEKNRAEAEFKQAVTNVSHDLRTPLTSVLGYLQMIESSKLDETTKSRYMEIIHERLEALSALVNSFFEFSLVYEGDIEIDAQSVDIHNALRDVLATDYLELESRGFNVEVIIPDTPIICMCDESVLRRVLQNLIKNAYTHGKEYLRVTLSRNMIEIANHADDIATIDTDRIFERFYTTDDSREKNTGLGLAIAKELTERMGGRIYAITENDLLVFQIILP